MKKLGTWERKTYRQIDGAVVEQGMWRIRTNQELEGDFKSRKLMEWCR